LNFPTDNGTINETETQQCLEPVPSGTCDGEIELCDRGTNYRIQKGANVLAGGAGGLVLANTPIDGDSVVADAHVLPAVHIGSTAAEELRQWLSVNSDTVATLSGTIVEVDTANADILAVFSSRGPNSSIEVIKPDISAPGVDIIAAFAQGDAPVAPEYGIFSGTSMSSPHHAGAAALLSLLTDWTPSEIKSALMMTSVRPEDLVKEDGVTPADPFDVGAGRLDLNVALRSSLVLDESIDNYSNANPAIGGDPKTLNIASMSNHACVGDCQWTRTVRNISGVDQFWSLSVTDQSGVTFSVSPESLSLESGALGEVTVSADVRSAESGFVFSELLLQPQDSSLPLLHMPIAVQSSNSTDPRLLQKNTDSSEVSIGESIDYDIVVSNGPIADPIEIIDLIPAGVTYVEGSAAANITNGEEIVPVFVEGDRLVWEGRLDRGGIEVANNGARTGFLPLAQFGIEPVELPSDPDDGGLIFDVPTFSYNGVEYSQVIWSVNGTLEVGVASALASGANNLQLPNPTPPNNLLAPLWTDLDFSNGGEAYIGSLTDGTNSFTVFEWSAVPLFGSDEETYSFQIWITVGTDDIWFTYGELSSTDIPITVGAENTDGTEGNSYYFNGEGIPPMPGVDLEVVATSGGSVQISFSGLVEECVTSPITNEAQLLSGSTQASAFAYTSCDVDLEQPDNIEEPPPVSPASNDADVNGDGRVDIEDLTIVLEAQNTIVTNGSDRLDLNDDGVIDLDDALIVITDALTLWRN
ncbi:MAG: S8 family serine peptidase, partial [Pseudomonadota bacterium]